MTEEKLFHSMSHAEREQLKQFARQGKLLEPAMIMFSHWMSCGVDVTFSDYASNWAAANTREDVGAIRTHWPLIGPRMIADNRTEWGSATGLV